MLTSKQIYYIYKSAAEDLASFYEEQPWIAAHPEIASRKRLSDVKKEIPLPDYRETVAVSKKEFYEIPEENRIDYILPFTEEIKKILRTFYIYIENQIVSLISQNDQILSQQTDDDTPEKINNDKIIVSRNDQLIDNLGTIPGGIADFIEAVDENHILQYFTPENEKFAKILVLSKPVVINSGGKKLNFAQNFKISVALQDLGKFFERMTGLKLPDSYGEIKEFAKNIKDFNSIDSVKHLTYLVSDKRKKEIERNATQNFDLVFSTKPSELLSMSIRASWASCQNLLDPIKTQNVKAIYSAVSPYVGIIYLTNKVDYMGRGEEMVARSLVFYVEHKETSAPALTVAQVYSNFNKQYVKGIFEKSLNENSFISVVPYEVAEKDYYFPTQDLNKEKNPYFDQPLDMRLVPRFLE